MRPFQAATRPASHPSTPIKTRLTHRVVRLVLDIGKSDSILRFGYMSIFRYKPLTIRTNKALRLGLKATDNFT